MRARVAYISSLGTTAILVAAALLMLAVVGAIVAFRGWPGAANAAGVQSVPLEPSLTTARSALVITRVNRVRAVVRAGTRTAAARRLTTVGLVKQVGAPVVLGVVKVPRGGSGPSMHPVFPQPGRPGPVFPAPAGRDPVTVPLPPSSPGDGSGQLVPVQLPGGGAAAPVAGQVDTVVGQVVAPVPPPPSLADGARAVLPLH
jgi:hypothetical protein